MSKEQYASVQRLLGLIEGYLIAIDDQETTGAAIDAVDALSDLIDKAVRPSD